MNINALLLQVKSGVFAEHSNQLWNISGVQLWSKVNSGLIKMYKVEVKDQYDFSPFYSDVSVEYFQILRWW